MITLSRRAALTALAAAPLAVSPAFAQAPPPGAPDDPRPKGPYPLIGQPAPDFELPRLGGGTARLKDYRGKVLALEFWGLWCPDCLLDGPNVNAFAAEAAKDKRLAFLAIHNRERFGKWGSVEAYFAEKGFSYPVALDPTREFSKETYKIPWWPSFVVVDKQGVVRHWRTDLTATGGAELLAVMKTLARA